MIDSKRFSEWARQDSNLRLMDYESRVLLLSGYLVKNYTPLLGQKWELQVVNK